VSAPPRNFCPPRPVLNTMPTPPRTLTALLRRSLLAAALPASAVALACLPAAATASSRQIAIVQDGALIQANPAGTLAQMRALGATTVRVTLFWDSVAPSIQATRKPSFKATDPNAYPAANWAPYDAIVNAAKADGMTIDFTVAGGAPRWAEGPGIPSNYVITKNNQGAKFFAWKPNAKDYGQFVQAVGTRYSGSFAPKGSQTKLPRVHFWTIWNEPNFGTDLGPQAADTSRFLYSPLLYRNLVRSGWSALQKTGHGKDTIVIGELAAHGYALSNGRHSKNAPQGLPGNAAQSQPLPFVRSLYCLDQQGHKLTGSAASQVGCPTTAKARAGFRKANPGLFGASGVGDHPYANNATPVSDGKSNKEWSTFPNLPRLEHTLDTANTAWGSHTKYSIYNDEYGYITDPPQQQLKHSVPVKTAAKYINWAEYLSWRSPRVASYSQYLLDDPPPNPITGNGGFATGLYTSKGKPKPSLDAYRLPLWLPSTTLKKPGPAKVWGEARPATWTGKDTKHTQIVQVQFQAHGTGAWTTIKTVKSDRYFVVRPNFTTSGNVRLRYTYPASDALLPLGVAGSSIVSRIQSITVR
jgi:hypothetical protein